MSGIQNGVTFLHSVTMETEWRGWMAPEEVRQKGDRRKHIDDGRQRNLRKAYFVKIKSRDKSNSRKAEK